MPFTAFWDMGKGRLGKENQKFRSLMSEIRCPNKDIFFIWQLNILVWCSEQRTGFDI